MTKTLTAALVAASVFGASTAFASGDYYHVGSASDAVNTQSRNVDRFQTDSIGHKRVVIRNEASTDQHYNRGDYRPLVPAANVN